MAKKVLQQLDLFGSLFDEPAAPVPETPAPAPVVEEKATEKIAPEIIPAPADNIVFTDDKIKVKIKAKPAAEKPAAIVFAEPVAKVAPVKEATVTPVKGKRGRKSYKEMDAELDLVDVPDEATLNKKLYYSISEVAGWFKVNASLIRAWENEFDILKPRKNRKGDRLFRPEDIKNLQTIYYLLRNRKYSIEGAKAYLRSNKKQVDVNVELTQSLTKFRSFLLELKANLGA